MAKQICLFAFGASRSPCFSCARLMIRPADTEVSLEIKQPLTKRILYVAVCFNGSLSDLPKAEEWSFQNSHGDVE